MIKSKKQNDNKTEQNEEKEVMIKDEKKLKSTWRDLFWKISVIAPYFWPKGFPWLQFRVIVCIFLLLSVRGFNVVVPHLQKRIIDDLSVTIQLKTFPWPVIVFYVGVKFLQGNGPYSGFINHVKGILWIRIEQHSTKKLKLQLFGHLHSLGIRWHNSRKTGEIFKVMDRGTKSITTLLNTVFFQILPTLIDVTIAIIALSTELNPWFGLIILVTTVIYLTLSILATEWKTKFKRSMNEAENEQRARSVDSLLNAETVKLYGNEQYELETFAKFIDKFQEQQWFSIGSMYLISFFQNLILNAGLLVGSLYCAFLITENSLTVGDYVLFGTYMAQLMNPLRQLAMLYRNIQEALVDMENMLDLMALQPEVKDVNGAVSFIPRDGTIEFKDVHFSYDPRLPVLRGVSFLVPAGQTLAIVGPSGAGKSTIVKLLFRFYDVTEGEVRIDDQDVKLMTQKSLRSGVGMVPQDAVLFNEDVEYNIRYGRTEAGREEVEEAAKLADVHEKIIGLVNGYETKVGERGLKLSGGEKQRVAIARTFLKSPKILLLDEATSSLDTGSERNIQAALKTVCSGRTCVMIAHRLSTVIHADIIILIKDGVIAEQGTHEQLLSQGGIYEQMWEKQLSSCHPTL